MIPFLIAGFGGMLPTLARIASSYVTAPQPLPGAGFFFGLALFFIIGGILAIAFGETSLKQALIVGISAPAIIQSVSTGLKEGQNAEFARNTSTVRERLVDTSSPGPRDGAWLWPGFTGTAYAQAAAPKPDAPRSDVVEMAAPIDRLDLFGDRTVELKVTVAGLDDAALKKIGAPVADLRFYDEGGYATGDPVLLDLSPTSVSGTVKQVSAPVTARGFVLSMASAKSTTKLPSSSFDKVSFDVTATVEKPSDFTWALGFERRLLDVKSLTVRQAGVSENGAMADRIAELAKSKVIGVDVSSFQPQILWDQLAQSNVRFAIVRATYGQRPDAKAEETWSSFKQFPGRGNFAIGLYHFYRFGQDPAAQAAAYLAVAQAKKHDRQLPPAVTAVGNPYDRGEAAADSARNERDFAKFLATVEGKLGRKAMILVETGNPPPMNVDAFVAGRPVWVKDTFNNKPSLPARATGFTLWLFGTGAVRGIPGGVVDLNVFNGDEAEFLRLVGAT